MPNARHGVALKSAHEEANHVVQDIDPNENLDAPECFSVSHHKDIYILQADGNLCENNNRRIKEEDDVSPLLAISCELI